MVRLVCVVGYPGSGKSAAADIAEEEFDIPSVTMGDRVRERATAELEEILTAETPESLVDTLDTELQTELRTEDGEFDLSKSNLIGSWATVQRDRHGDAVVADWTAEYIRDNIDADTVLVDGMRACDERDIFKAEFDEVDVVYIKAPFETRLDRLRDRGRDGEDEFTAAQLEERDAREESWGVDVAVAAADYTIENTGSLAEYKTELERILLT